MKKIIFLIAFIIFTASTVSLNSETSSKRKEIEKLFKVMKLTENMKLVMLQMKTMIRQNMPNVPDEFFDIYLTDNSINEMISSTIDVYEKHFTEKDIKELLKFYNSPIGKKTIEKMPLIMQESMYLGQKWAEKKLEELKIQAKKDGYSI